MHPLNFQRSRLHAVGYNDERRYDNDSYSSITPIQIIVVYGMT